MAIRPLTESFSSLRAVMVAIITLSLVSCGDKGASTSQTKIDQKVKVQAPVEADASNKAAKQPLPEVEEEEVELGVPAPDYSIVPLMSATADPSDANMMLIGAPMPPTCGKEGDSVKFCPAPYPVFLTEARYARFKKVWGLRKSERTHLRKLLQKRPHNFLISLHREEEPPLAWLLPNVPRTFRLYPVIPELSQVQFLSMQEEVVTLEPRSEDTLDVVFPESAVPPYSRYEIAWGRNAFLFFSFRKPNPPFHIVIDPGHGGVKDRGATRDQLTEAALTLELANVFKGKLEALGMKVTLTRTEDKAVSLLDRLVLGQDEGVTLFISLHNDAISTGQLFSRAHCYYGRADLAPLCRKTTESVKDLYRSQPGYNQRHLFVLHGTVVPSILFEVLNLSDFRHLKILSDQKLRSEFFTTWSDRISKVLNEELLKSAALSDAMPRSQADGGSREVSR